MAPDPARFYTVENKCVFMGWVSVSVKELFGLTRMNRYLGTREKGAVSVMKICQSFGGVGIGESFGGVGIQESFGGVGIGEWFGGVGIQESFASVGIQDAFGGVGIQESFKLT